VLYVGAHGPAQERDNARRGAPHGVFPEAMSGSCFTRRNPLVPEAIVCERAAIATLVALYRGALVVAVPSVYEGFGLPVLEAMACGAPVLAARAAALPEVGGDVAAYVDDVRDCGAWQRALLDIAANAERRATMARSGRCAAATFTWEDCTLRTLAILRSAAALPIAPET